MLQDIRTRVQSFIGARTQPNLFDCQATSIHIVTGGKKSIGAIRASLLEYGDPGEPGNIGDEICSLINPKLYEYKDNASIADMRRYLNEGCVLIVHGYLSNSGHVFVLDGRKDGLFDVVDVFEEFDAATWSYPKYWSNFRKAYNGYYSELLIYATCVAGGSFADAEEIYRRGRIDDRLGNAWLHIIKPG